MALNGKLVKVTYNLQNGQRFLRGRVVEDTELFLAVRGLRDGTIFRIAKNTIAELVELNGGQAND